ncbi:MAG TPA: flippase activity-associated protein Agl23 [Candidatus Angelobacter sp.]|nr:flippase activity-associated protein Agl23 [Candidatus Angelobacter sp.]
MKPASREKRIDKKRPRTSRASQAQPVTGVAGLLRRLSPWQWAAAGILTGAAVLRLVELTLKPLHHDEGVNGSFLTTLFRGGYYRYDPSNYHGPSLYYFAWIITTFNSLFYGKQGLSTFAIRLTTVLFGVGLVWLLLCLRRELGSFGALVAAALAAVSPGMVFFSRYFIHEILFVFFTLGVLVAVLRFRRASQPRYLMLAAASAALLGTTKETWVITVAVWMIALPCTWAWIRLRREKDVSGASSVHLPVPDVLANSGTRVWRGWEIYAAAALLFLAVWVLLYSSFFTNFPQGVLDSVRTFGYWFKTSKSDHSYGVTKYLEWLWQQEAPVLILGAVGIVIALWRARSRFAVFTAFWSLGILAAYSLVSYKTPWCALNILLPGIIMAGYGLERLYQLRPAHGWKALVPHSRGAIALAAIAAGVGLYQAIDLNFYRYDDDTRAYVYAHTQRDFLGLVNEIDSIAAGQPAGKDIGILVMSPEHWPLPWYLRDYKNAVWGKSADPTEPILVVHESQVLDVESKFGAKYRLISSHDLRPGNRLYLYLRRDLQP